jgi:hypothetical protein
MSFTQSGRSSACWLLLRFKCGCTMIKFMAGNEVFLFLPNAGRMNFRNFMHHRWQWYFWSCFRSAHLTAIDQRTRKCQTLVPIILERSLSFQRRGSQKYFNSNSLSNIECAVGQSGLKWWSDHWIFESVRISSRYYLPVGCIVTFPSSDAGLLGWIINLFDMPPKWAPRVPQRYCCSV